MGLSAAPLVGRVAELAHLEHALSEVTRGRWGALDLVGEPGIGKTRLLEELRDHADRRGALVLSGSGSELERDLPFWVFVNALDDFVRALDPRLLEQLDGEVRADLAHVLPALVGRETGRTAPLAHERYRTHRAVRELLERLTATRPLVLILDDLHWADPASVELIGSLLRRPPDAAVLVALALRPDPARDAARRRARARPRSRDPPPHPARRTHPRRRRPAARQSVRPCSRLPSVRGERRQPVLPPAARQVLTSSAGGIAGGPGAGGGPRRTCGGRGHAGRRSSPSSARARAWCCGAQPSSATRSNQSSPPRPRA